jgi:hypothetical protein
MDDLVKAAKAEGQLTTIALPHDWCGYGAVIDGFKAKYPEITVNELNPDAGSGDEVEAIKANKGNKGPQAPDVIDVGLSFGPTAKNEGLLAPYKVSTWKTIPDSAKDAEGFWYGDYYGVLSFQVNKDIIKNVPADWADLQKDEYKNQYIGQFTPGSGFDIIRTTRGSLNISVYGLFRFLDQTPGKQTFTDHLGRERTVAARNDINWHRTMIWFSGFFYNPKFRYTITAWSLPTTEQTLVFGLLRYVASPLVTAMLRGGIVILDEGNRMSEKSWASLAPLLDNRRYIESIVAGIKIKAHPLFRLVATMNDDASTFDLPEYIHSRLQPQILIDFPERLEELAILRELGQSKKLSSIKQLVLEFHHHVGDADELSRVLGILEANDFGYQLLAPLRRDFLGKSIMQDILIHAYQKA